MYGKGAPEGLICCDLTDEQKSWFTEELTWPLRPYEEQAVVRWQDVVTLRDLSLAAQGLYESLASSPGEPHLDLEDSRVLTPVPLATVPGSYTVGSLTYEIKSGWLSEDLASFYAEDFLAAKAIDPDSFSPFPVPGLLPDGFSAEHFASLLLRYDLALCLFRPPYNRVLRGLPLSVVSSALPKAVCAYGVILDPSFGWAWKTVKDDQEDGAGSWEDSSSASDYLSLCAGGSSVVSDPICGRSGYDPAYCADFLGPTLSRGVVDFCFKVADCMFRNYACRIGYISDVSSARACLCDVASESPSPEVLEPEDLVIDSVSGVVHDYTNNQCGNESTPADEYPEKSSAPSESSYMGAASFTCMLSHSHEECTCTYYESDSYHKEAYDHDVYQFSVSRYADADGTAPHLYCAAGSWMPRGVHYDAATIFLQAEIVETVTGEEPYTTRAFAWFPVHFAPIGLQQRFSSGRPSFADGGKPQLFDYIVWRSEDDVYTLMKQAVAAVSAQTSKEFNYTGFLSLDVDAGALKSAAAGLDDNLTAQFSVTISRSIYSSTPNCAVYEFRDETGEAREVRSAPVPFDPYAAVFHLNCDFKLS